MAPRRKRDTRNQAPNEPNLVQPGAVTTGIDAPAPSHPLPSKPRRAKQSKPKPPTKGKAPTKYTGICGRSPDGGWYNANGPCPAPSVPADQRTWMPGAPSHGPPSETSHSMAESPLRNAQDSQVLVGDVNELGSLSSDLNKGSDVFDTRSNAYTIPSHNDHTPQIPPSDFAFSGNVPSRSAPFRLNPASTMLQGPIHSLSGMEYGSLPAPEYVAPGSSSAFGEIRFTMTSGSNVTAHAAPSVSSALYHPHHRPNALYSGVPQFAGPHHGQPSQYNSVTMSHHGQQGQVFQQPVQYTTPESVLPPPATLPPIKRKRTASVSEAGDRLDEAKKVKLTTSFSWDDDLDFSSDLFQPLEAFADEGEASTGSLLEELLADDSEGYLSGPSTSESSFGVDTPEPDSEPEDAVRKPAPPEEKQKPEEVFDFDLEIDARWFGDEVPEVFDGDDFDGL
ncbi:hypothetical protein CPB85DRAFT_1430363 [Mucidula mucida]|nr:hypothetical protein CPB85DRAFT_1430363 [Mucidula mucida]